MKVTRKNPKLEQLIEELTKAELTRARAMLSVTKGPGHCKGFSGDITLCAVLCEGMMCREFQWETKWPLPDVKCRGFSGEPDKCTAFRILSPK